MISETDFPVLREKASARSSNSCSTLTLRSASIDIFLQGDCKAVSEEGQRGQERVPRPGYTRGGVGGGRLRRCTGPAWPPSCNASTGRRRRRPIEGGGHANPDTPGLRLLRGAERALAGARPGLPA